ncbi:MAG TPA: cofactor-independent phosphoglycerate mutase [Phycisphaerae bacterium]|jgi:2,3-bisphosphoglycerate-independent phosphoglycerate mutase|nr:cofactor-independent phosphoglycerate mutase [Phycisphaerae bacterium]
MKYALIIPDGAADTPIADLGNKTPLEVAHKPHMDSVASSGKLGTVRTTPPGYSAGSDVCTLCLLGYDPAKYHPGRAPLEAAAMGLKLDAQQDWVFRCNLVTIKDGIMMDHSAGHIGDAEARILLEEVRKALAPDPGTTPLTFYPGVSYRNLMTHTGGDFTGLKCTPPHDIPEQPIKGYMPKGKGGDLLTTLINRSHEVLSRHEINLTRRDLGENEATHIWLWGQGRAGNIPTFQSRFKKQGAMITAVDLLRGIANLLGWQNLDCPGITSYHDTDYAMQGKVTCDALDKYDIVCCHVEAPDEASHAANTTEKIASIEAIDKHVIGPVLEKLKTYDEWRMLIMPDHATQCATRKHYDEPVPFAIAGTAMPGRRDKTLPYTEAAAKQGDLHVQQGYDLMEYFLYGNLAK